MDRRLGIYLNDHLAGATLGVELARRLRAGNRDDPEFGPTLIQICTEIEADRRTLQSIMERLEVRVGRLKPTAALVAERLGRSKLNGQLRGYSPLSRLEELEMLQVGVLGKHRLWLALEQTHPSALQAFDLGMLAERATDQLRRLESLHAKAASLAL